MAKEPIYTWDIPDDVGARIRVGSRSSFTLSPERIREIFPTESAIVDELDGPSPSPSG